MNLTDINTELLKDRDTAILDLPFLHDIVLNTSAPVYPFGGQHRVFALKYLRERNGKEIQKLSEAMYAIQTETNSIDEELAMMESWEAPSQSTINGLRMRRAEIDAQYLEVSNAGKKLTAVQNEGAFWVIDLYDQCECLVIFINGVSDGVWQRN